MLIGTAPVDAFLSHAATMPNLDTPAVTIPEAVVVQALFEIRVSGRDISLPPALHPTNPPTFVAQFWYCPQSPWGPFSLAQGRVGSRSGLRPRGFIQGCICDNPVAAESLRLGWGLPVQEGFVTIQRNYDGVNAAAGIGETTVIEVYGRGPDPLGPDDISYSAGVSMAYTPRGLRLVQCDMDMTAQRAERVKPKLLKFTNERWGIHPAVDPYFAVSASVAAGELALQKLRYLCKPDELAFSGTETVGEF